MMMPYFQCIKILLLGITVFSCYLMITFHPIDASSDHPLCRPLSYLRGKWIGENDMKYIIVGDIHGDVHGLMEILIHANVIVPSDDLTCKWNQSITHTTVIQMGDVVDRGKYSLEAFNCLENLQNQQRSGNAVVRLVGNHELLWLEGIFDYRNPQTDSFEKIISIVTRLKQGIENGKIHGAAAIWVRDIPFLFSHAGLRPQMMQSLIKQAPPNADTSNELKYFASAIQSSLFHAMSKCVKQPRGTFICPLQDELFGAGPERGGKGIGGSYWTDFSVLKQVADQDIIQTIPFVQIVGHSIAVNHIRATPTMSAICVDVGVYLGGRAYLEISNQGHIVAFESIPKQSSQPWRRSDLSEQFC